MVHFTPVQAHQNNVATSSLAQQFRLTGPIPPQINNTPERPDRIRSSVCCVADGAEEWPRSRQRQAARVKVPRCIRISQILFFGIASSSASR